jgi:hypothetical protein
MVLAKGACHVATRGAERKRSCSGKKMKKRFFSTGSGLAATSLSLEKEYKTPARLTRTRQRPLAPSAKRQ